MRSVDNNNMHRRYTYILYVSTKHGEAWCKKDHAHEIKWTTAGKKKLSSKTLMLERKKIRHFKSAACVWVTL